MPQPFEPPQTQFQSPQPLPGQPSGYGPPHYPGPPGPTSQFQNPYPYSAAPPSRGVPVWVWVALAIAMLGIFGGVVVIGVFVAVRSGTPTASTTAAASEEDPADDTSAPVPTARRTGPKASLPPVQRSVPTHPLSILRGCSTSDLASIERSIDSAIKVGAPAYNAGDFQGCYATYDRTALRLESALSASCTGPTIALQTGRANALERSTPADRAWAMRDAFDGLLDVIDRSAR